MKRIILAVTMFLSCSAFAADMPKGEMNTDKLSISDVVLPAPESSAAASDNALPASFYAVVGGTADSETRFETLRKIFEKRATLPRTADLLGYYSGRAYNRVYPNKPYGTIFSGSVRALPTISEGPLFDKPQKKFLFACFVNPDRNPERFDNFNLSNAENVDLAKHLDTCDYDLSVSPDKKAFVTGYISIKVFVDKGNKYIICRYFNGQTEFYEYYFKKLILK